MDRGFVGLFALLVTGLSVSGLAGTAAASILPSPDFTLDVDVTQDDRVLNYTIRFENVGNGSAPEVILLDVPPAGATYLGDPGDLVGGVWTRTYANVTGGVYVETVSVELNASVADGDRVVNAVEIQYRGIVSPWISETYVLEFGVSFPPPPPPPPPPDPPPPDPPPVPPPSDPPSNPSSPFPMWVAAAVAVPAAGVAGGLLVQRRRHRPHLEQVFLVHNSGMLIHHWEQATSVDRDTDILSGMFVVLRNFVRDSFREKTGGLTQMQFGESRLLIAEGTHSILAAVVRGERVNGMSAQIAAAVRDFERRHAARLPDWDGRLENIPQAKDVVEVLVKGGYAHRRLNS